MTHHLITAFCAPSPKRVFWGGIVIKEEALSNILEMIRRGYTSHGYDCDYQIAAVPDATFETISSEHFFQESGDYLLVDNFSELMQNSSATIAHVYPLSLISDLKSAHQIGSPDETQLARIREDFAGVIEKYKITRFHHFEHYSGKSLYQSYFQKRPKFKEFDTTYNGGYLWTRKLNYERTGIEVRPLLIVGLSERFIYCRICVDEGALGLARNTKNTMKVDRKVIERDGVWKKQSQRGYRMNPVVLDPQLTEDYVFVYTGDNLTGNFYYTNDKNDITYRRAQEAKSLDISMDRYRAGRNVEYYEQEVLKARRQCQNNHPDKGGDAEQFQKWKKELEANKIALSRCLAAQRAAESTGRKYDGF